MGEDHFLQVSRVLAHLVEAAVHVLRDQHKIVQVGVFNVAGGRDISILDLLKILNKILRKDVPPLLLNRRPGDVFRTLADIRASAKILKFKPVVDFVTGLKITVDYWKNNA